MSKENINSLDKLRKFSRESISTLEAPGLTNIRRDGNTTRQTDFAIQKLFEGYDVICEDHYDSNSTKLNERLAQSIANRFKGQEFVHNLNYLCIVGIESRTKLRLMSKEVMQKFEDYCYNIDLKRLFIL